MFREVERPEHIRFFKNMAPNDFLKVLYNSRCLIGNSSVGIRECSFLGVPVINIGTRQAGRDRGRNVIDVDYDRQEITAALEAVTTLSASPGPIDVVSDSTYVVNCFRDKWYVRWQKRGWVNSQRKPVANRDLWEPLVELFVARGDVTFRWVKGHGDDPMNDLVDQLAVEAALTQRGRTGDLGSSVP